MIKWSDELFLIVTETGHWEPDGPSNGTLNFDRVSLQKCFSSLFWLYFGHHHIELFKLAWFIIINGQSKTVEP